MMTRVAGAVLAAGAGTRMGRPKALLQAGPRSLLSLLAGALREGGCEPILLVVAPHLDRAAAGEIPGARWVVNPDPARGQISSLRCALAAVPRAEGLLLLLVDQGEVTAHTVAVTRLALARQAAAVACFQGAEGHPLAFRQELFADVMAAQADQGARAAVAEWRRRGILARVETGDAGVTRNLNTPEDFQRFLAQRGVHA